MFQFVICLTFTAYPLIVMFFAVIRFGRTCIIDRFDMLIVTVDAMSSYISTILCAEFDYFMTYIVLQYEGIIQTFFAFSQNLS